MKKSLVLIFLFIFMTMSLLPASVAAPAEVTGDEIEDVSVTNGCNSLDGKTPVINNQNVIPNMTAAFLFDVDMQIVLYSLNPDVPMQPASFVKIMTALIAVEEGNLDEIVVIKDRVISTVPKSAVTANLQPNESISLSDLLYCMMVGSANDAAAVIADHIAGSQESFIDKMNRKAQELGCTGTVFTNPHGLYDPQQVTTARDVAKILNYAHRNSDFMTYFSEEYYVVPETNKYASRSLYTNNYLMYSVDNMRIYRDYRSTGGRTGLDENGGRCVAATAEEDGRTLISVIFGAQSVYDEERKTTITFGGFKETSDLWTMGFEDCAPVQVLYEGQIFRQYAVAGGENHVVVGSDRSAYSVLPVSASGKDLSFRYFDEADAFTAPITKGKKLSHVQIWYGNVCVAQTDLYAMSEVRSLNTAAEQQEIDVGNGFWRSAVVIIAAIVVCLILFAICVRLVSTLRMAVIRRRGRKYRRNHRRIR